MSYRVCSHCRFENGCVAAVGGTSVSWWVREDGTAVAPPRGCLFFAIATNLSTPALTNYLENSKILRLAGFYCSLNQRSS